MHFGVPLISFNDVTIYFYYDKIQGRSQDFVIGGAKRKVGEWQVLKILKFLILDLKFFM